MRHFTPRVSQPGGLVASCRELPARQESLNAAVPDGNGYDPSVTAAERASAIAKWEAWFQTHMVSAANKQAKK